MRELSNVFQGICAARPDFYVKQSSMVRLWLHECYRVYSDRLISPTEIRSRFGTPASSRVPAP